MSTEILLVIAVLTGLIIGYLIASFILRTKANGLKQVYEKQHADFNDLKIKFQQVAE